MDFYNQYEAEKHKIIIDCYKKTIPFLRRGTFRVHLGTFLFFAWIFVWTESAIRYYSLDYVDFSLKNPRIYILPVILLIVGWRLFRPYRSLTEKTCFGKISSVKLKSEYVKGKQAGRRVFFLPVVVARISVDLGNGKTHKIKCRISPKTREMLTEGTYITVITGEKLPVCHDKTKYGGELFCTNCGSLSSQSYTLCFHCKKRLWTKEL